MAMHILLDSRPTHRQMLPLTFARPAADMRVGILTIAEKWERHTQAKVYHLTPPYLQKAYPLPAGSDFLCINAAILPDHDLSVAVLALPPGHSISDSNGQWLATRTEDLNHPAPLKKNIWDKEVAIITRPWDIFKQNEREISRDIALLQVREISDELRQYNTVFGRQVYATGAVEVRGAILNSETGPIFLEEGSEIMEGAVVRGPLAMCNGAALKMGAKVYGATTLGPHCKAGGELNNVVMQGYSNKGHDGFLGNSVIGTWCNLGADTNASNLKNNYSLVRAYSYAENHPVDTGSQFCGLIMGDHAKTGINTMLNTGTVVGFSANVFGADFPPKHIPSFSWGGASGFSRFDLQKALEVARRMMQRRNMPLTEIDEEIFSYLHSLDAEAK